MFLVLCGGDLGMENLFDSIFVCISREAGRRHALSGILKTAGISLGLGRQLAGG